MLSIFKYNQGMSLTVFVHFLQEQHHTVMQLCSCETKWYTPLIGIKQLPSSHKLNLPLTLHSTYTATGNKVGLFPFLKLRLRE